jgi:hypothetical protein
MLNYGDSASDFKKNNSISEALSPFFFILQKISKKMNYNISIIGRRHEQGLIREYYDSPKALWKRLIVHSFFISNRQCQFGNSYNG